jgi:hypothetical protein
MGLRFLRESSQSWWKLSPLKRVRGKPGRVVVTCWLKSRLLKVLSVSSLLTSGGVMSELKSQTMPDQSRDR